MHALALTLIVTFLTSLAMAIPTPQSDDPDNGDPSSQDSQAGSSASTPESSGSASISQTTPTTENSQTSSNQEPNTQSGTNVTMAFCTDPGAMFFAECWDILNLRSYLNDPVTGWNQTTPTCNATQDGDNCCMSYEPWTTCFLRLGHGYGGGDCSQINSKGCAEDDKEDVADVILAQVHYVMHTIYAINNFFSTWYNALPYAEVQASLAITNIITELDPPVNASISLEEVLLAFSVGLAFLGAPEIAVAILSLASATRIAVQAFLISVQQAPSVGRALWPQGSNTENIQIGALDSAISGIVGNLSQTIDNALQLVMSDMPTFVAFSAYGTFSGNSTPSLPNGTEGLDFALRTYVLTTAMSRNGWYAHYSTGYTTKFQVEENFSNVDGSAETCQMDANSICGFNAYWSNTTNTVYSLAKDTGWALTGNNLMETIVTNGWADLSTMFDAGLNCTLLGKMGDNAISFSEDGHLDLSCISQLDFCRNGCSPCPVEATNGTCPFPICPGIAGQC